MRVRVAAASIWIALLGACSPVTEYGSTASTGELKVSLNGASPLATIVVTNVFDNSQVFLIDCAQKDHLLNGEPFCDELTVLPPGVYEIIVQSQDPDCRSEFDHYKVIVSAGETVEVPINLVCGGANGGLDVIVTEEEIPIVTGISFSFASSELTANKFVCACGEDVVVEVQVEDSDTACEDLTVAWSALDAEGNVVPDLLSNPQAIPPEHPGDPCRFTVTVHAGEDLESYRITFRVSDGTHPPTEFTFPIHVIDCGLCAACDPGLTSCGGQCVDLLTDNSNCGACGDRCKLSNATSQCVAGECQLLECEAGFDNCDGDPSNGCEQNILTDTNNCGSCGNACDLPGTSAHECNEGHCVAITCEDGFASCDEEPLNGCETDTLTDSENCGSCGTRCAADQSCQSGLCVCLSGTYCPPSLVGIAPVSCVDVNTDVHNCGACYHTCEFLNAVPSCDQGICVLVSCDIGWLDCNGDPGDGCEYPGTECPQPPP